jgi:hypothetical protein
MKTLSCHVVLIAGFLISASDRGYAQQATVQQPVVQVFSVDTVVSVPDRGAAYLGGVSSAAEGRGSYGPFPAGSGTGLRRTHTGVDAGVYIHDFEAMDQSLLSRPVGRERDPWVNPNARAAAAFDSLREGRFARTRSPGFVDAPVGESRRSTADTRRSRGSGPPQTDNPTELAGFYFARARDAEQQGKGGVAVLCYRMAARHGSRYAEQRLRELGPE